MNTLKSTLLLILLSLLTFCLPPAPATGTFDTPSRLPQPSLAAVDPVTTKLITTGTAEIPTGPTQSTSTTADGTVFLPLVTRFGSNTNYGEGSWPMVAANPERTSWTPDEVFNGIQLEWYRPIEAYIPQNIQVIAEYGLLYISTSRGLYALNATNGETVWRFDTELPLGHSPSVKDGVVYVGGYDRKLHALDAYTGRPLWAFSEAQAGFDTNPLIVEGKVIVGNRDGYLYAIGAHATPRQGQLIWKFETGGPIHLSAAYKDGVVYFAANDNYAYALTVDNGQLVWKSEKLPGDGFHSFWPVIFRDQVIFSGSISYRMGLNPGTLNVPESSEFGYGKFYDMERDSIWPNDLDGTLIGPEVTGQTWANGYPVLDASKITEYYEDNPAFDQYKHKPWRRVVIVLNRSDGTEFTFDSDHDGFKEYIPATMWGTHSGNRYPPVVGPDGILYMMNIWQKFPIPQGRIMGWNPDTPSYLSVIPAMGAVDEPQSISAGGNLVYRSISSDRVGDAYNITDPSRSERIQYWHYSNPLFEQAPGYDEMMWLLDPDSPDRMFGSYGNINGLYFQGGDQNPIVPYQGRLFTHRSNAVIAYGPGSVLGKQSLLTINSTNDDIVIPTQAELVERLDDQIQRIVSLDRFLRPGYMNNGQFYLEFADYFENPGETLYTLARAYPYLSNDIQVQTRDYLKRYFQEYFDPTMYVRTGWADGDSRESMPLPPEVETALSEQPAMLRVHPRWSWSYPPQNFYAMWKYAQIFPEDAGRVYDLAKSKLQVPVPDTATNDYLLEKTWEHNAYMSGYIGFLKLQELAGMTNQDSQLRSQVSAELNRLLGLRFTTFTKDTIWTDWQNIHKRHFNVSRNFMYLVPELGDYYRQNIPFEVQQAIDEYNFVAPYWFVSRYETVHNEGVITHPFNYHAMFQAKAYILDESREELMKYLDVPAFERGDLFYIDNLLAVISAP